MDQTDNFFTLRYVRGKFSKIHQFHRHGKTYIVPLCIWFWRNLIKFYKTFYFINRQFRKSVTVFLFCHPETAVSSVKGYACHYRTIKNSLNLGIDEKTAFSIQARGRNFCQHNGHVAAFFIFQLFKKTGFEITMGRKKAKGKDSKNKAESGKDLAQHSTGYQGGETYHMRPPVLSEAN